MGSMYQQNIGIRKKLGDTKHESVTRKFLDPHTLQVGAKSERIRKHTFRCGFVSIFSPCFICACRFSVARNIQEIRLKFNTL